MLQDQLAHARAALPRVAAALEACPLALQQGPAWQQMQQLCVDAAQDFEQAASCEPPMWLGCGPACLDLPLGAQATDCRLPQQMPQPRVRPRQL